MERVNSGAIVPDPLEEPFGEIVQLPETKTNHCTTSGNSQDIPIVVEDHVPYFDDVSTTTVSNGSTASYTCKDCTKLFCSESDMESHWQTMHSAGPFACIECAELFALKKDLDAHLVKHITEESSSDSNLVISEDSLRQLMGGTHDEKEQQGQEQQHQVFTNVTLESSAYILRSASSTSEYSCVPIDSSVVELSNQMSTEIPSESHEILENILACSDTVTKCIQNFQYFDQNTINGYHDPASAVPSIPTTAPNDAESLRLYDSSATSVPPDVADEAVPATPDVICIDIDSDEKDDGSTTSLTENYESENLSDSLVTSDQHTTDIPTDPNEATINTPTTINIGDLSSVCSYCGDQFPTKGHLFVHLRNYHDIKAYECSQCAQKFAYKTDLTRHMRTHTGDPQKPFGCSRCPKLFSKNSELKKHERVHGSRKQNICTICSKVLSSKRNLRLHYMHLHGNDDNNEIEDDTGYPECQVCNKSFISASQLMAHLREHFALQPSACSDPPESAKLDDLDRPIGSKSAPSSEANPENNEMDDVFDRFECIVCNKLFKDTSDLMAHLSYHISLLPEPGQFFEIANSGQRLGDSMSEESELRESNYVITNETNTNDVITSETNIDPLKPYSCEHCGKSFTNPKSLRLHSVKHTGAHACEHCGRGFSQSHHLKSHLMTHTGEKPFQCKYCEKSFTRNDILKKHMKTHQVHE